MVKTVEVFMQKKKLIFALLIALLLFLTACNKKADETIQLSEKEEVHLEEIDSNDKQISTIYVYVCGAVQTEGVYQLPDGSRVYEAISAAGGFRADAATTQVNQAEILEDEMTVYVPTISEGTELFQQKESKININKASKEELMTLPGVGESRAESIIRYREENGKFQSIEDIKQISGIKDALYESIKDLIKI